MATDFSALIPDEQKRAILENTIQQLAYQGYQQELNLKTAEALASQKRVTEAVSQIAETEAILITYQEALDALPAPVVE